MNTPGIVVSTENAGAIKHTVFVDHTKPLYFVKRLEERDWRTMSKDERKYYDKEARKMEVDYGDTINFDEPATRNRVIEKYEKDLPLVEIRYFNEKHQMKATCVFAPRKSGGGRVICISTLFGPLDVSEEVAARYLPDVAYIVWVEFTQTRIMTAKFQLEDYDSLADTQDFVSDMEWNRGNKRCAAKLLALEEDVEDGMVYPSFRDRANMNSEIGLVIEARTIHSPACADMNVLIGYLPEGMEYKPGQRVMFDAQYSSPLRAMITTRVRLLTDETTDIPTLALEFGAVNMFEIAVQMSQDMPFGYFTSEPKMFGTIHDPQGLLTPLLIHGCHQAVQVYVVAARPSGFSRFAVKDTNVGETPKLLREAKKDYQPLQSSGIVLDGGQVLCTEVPTLPIHFDDNMSVPGGWRTVEAGTWVSFVARSAPGEMNYTVHEWHRSFAGIQQPIATAIQESAGRVYQTVCHWSARYGAFMSEVFGLVDDPRLVVDEIKKKEGCGITLWVRSAGTDSCTRFIVYGTKISEKPAQKAYEPSAPKEKPDAKVKKELPDDASVVSLSDEEGSSTMNKKEFVKKAEVPPPPPRAVEGTAKEPIKTEVVGAEADEMAATFGMMSFGSGVKKEAGGIPTGGMELKEEPIEKKSNAEAAGEGGSFSRQAAQAFRSCDENCELRGMLRQLLTNRMMLYLSKTNPEFLQMCLQYDLEGEDDDSDDADDHIGGGGQQSRTGAATSAQAY